MKRVAMLMAVAAVVVGCEDAAAPVTPSQPIQPEPTFVVFGRVRDEANVPIAAAAAEITTGVYRGLTRFSNDSGFFSLVGVRGPMHVRVWKEGYGPQVHSVLVTADHSLDVMLARVEYSDTIVFGKTIRSFVLNGHQPCDRNWDARAPCRPYLIRPPITGWLTVVITWVGDPELDAAIVSSRGAYLAYSTSSVNESVALVMYVAAGETYELRVHAYYGTQFFDLKTELTPYIPGD